MSSFELAPLIIGLSFGFSNGISPGPLCFLTISETLRGGFKEGLKVGCSPFVTDLPIILFSIFAFDKISHTGHNLLSLIAVAGAVFLFFLAYKSATFKFSGTIASSKETSNALVKGITTNLLNPYPYLFWITVGAPYLESLAKMPTVNTVLFFVHFYLGMSAAKIIIITTAAKGRKLLTSKSYIICMRLIAVLMFASAIKFLVEAKNIWNT